jgi:menaquinone-9 beta-reductase
LLNHQDVTIIGGGPAGCVAAIALARQSRSVLLVEQRKFPRDKVCGDCLSSVGIETLENLGLAAAVRRLGVVTLRQAIIHAANGSSCRIALPRPMWGVSRQALDTALLKSAREAGVRIFQPARCEAIEAGRPAAARIRDLSTHASQRVESSWILVADGKAALLPRHRRSGDLGVKATFALAGHQEAIELFGVRGHYGGLAPVEAGKWNCAFSVPASRIARYQGDLNALMQAVIRENPALSRRLGGAVRLTPWIASPLPRFGVQRHWPEGIIPIGNAAAAIEPIGGEGMGLAMRSAFWAAQFIGDNRSISRDTRELVTRFARLWRSRRAACRTGAMALSFPLAARLMVAVASASERLTELALRASGKFDGVAEKPSPVPSA